MNNRIKYILTGYNITHYNLFKKIICTKFTNFNFELKYSICAPITLSATFNITDKYNSMEFMYSDSIYYIIKEIYNILNNNQKMTVHIYNDADFNKLIDLYIIISNKNFIRNNNCQNQIGFDINHIKMFCVIFKDFLNVIDYVK